jgi:hypothetical protein
MPEETTFSFLLHKLVIRVSRSVPIHYGFLFGLRKVHSVLRVNRAYFAQTKTILVWENRRKKQLGN